MITYIYGLYENEDQGNIRYVGKTVNLIARLAAHLAEVANTHKCRWIQSVLANGGKIQIKVLEVITDASVNWQEREIYWISVFTEAGFSLTNATDGGEGGPGGPSGSFNGKAKITEQEVVALRERYAKGGIEQEELGRIFGLTKSAVGHILTGRTWVQVEGPITKKKFLSEEQKTEIKRRYAVGFVTQRQLAAEFGISQASVAGIVGVKTSYLARL